MEDKVPHYSVLLKESIENLNIKPNGIYVDATLGLGGHSKEIVKRLTTGHLYSFDEDEKAIDYSRKRLESIGSNFTLIHSNFIHLKEELEKRGVNKIDGILFDLGVSSPQIDDASRGFSFMKEGRLDMRMDTTSSFSAYEVVNNYKENELVDIFYKYGEEKCSKVIAKKIVENRPIETTTELCKIIESAVGSKYYYTKHPERQIFQSIRIEVNHELDVLDSVLPDVVDLLNKRGRISIITFHSLEDRIVKHFFKKESEVDPLYRGLPIIPAAMEPKLKLVTKKPILPSEEELKENSRSLSAKLRVAERI